MVDQRLRDLLLDIDRANAQTAVPAGQSTTGRRRRYFINENLNLVTEAPAGNNHVIDPDRRVLNCRWRRTVPVMVATIIAVAQANI